jgi:hypothetical protein
MRVSVRQFWRVIRLIVLIVGDLYTMPRFSANQDWLRAPRALPPRSGGQHLFSGLRSSYESDDDWWSAGRQPRHCAGGAVDGQTASECLGIALLYSKSTWR